MSKSGPPRRVSAAPRQERSRATLDVILTAAQRALDEKGSDGLGMREVARAAEVSTGTLYQYFPNKESLLHALEKRSWEQLFANVREKVLAWPELPAFERTVRVIELTVADLVVSIRKHGLSPLEEIPPETMELRRFFVEWLGASLPVLFEAAGIKMLPPNAKLAARLIFQVVMNLSKAGSIDNPPELENGEYAREVGLLVTRYLLGTATETPASSLPFERPPSDPAAAAAGPTVGPGTTSGEASPREDVAEPARAEGESLKDEHHVDGPPSSQTPTD